MRLCNVIFVTWRRSLSYDVCFGAQWYNVFNTAKTRVFVAAVCDSNCARCVTNGPGKCDANQCNDGYTYSNETQTCDRT